MKRQSDPQRSGPERGQIISGFAVTRVASVPAVRCVAREAYHQLTGARLLHLAADDAENLFAIAFRTPPPNDSGLPHILEHSVLGGSRKFPVKDPFVEMLKASMATFINAMTYPDRTVYPVASNVRKDFFNLVDVYCDAVFHPNITAATLKQEGHHLEFSDPEDMATPLTVRGIVYNEMKGAYSDLDSLIERESERLLFPDTPYGFDSGGDPERIPDLRYDEFVEFYRGFYHPSNARILLYGDIPFEEHLAFLDERLRACDGGAPADSRLPRQPRWPDAHTVEVPYPVESDDDCRAKTAVVLNWLVGDAADAAGDLAMEVVDRLLLGNAAAPLRKALVDSQLGEDLTSSGYGSGSLETTFHVGLKGTEPERRQHIVELVLDTLREVVRNGFPRRSVDAAFQQLQYGHREIRSAHPLHVMEWVFSSWNFDLDPLTYLRAGECLDKLYAEYLEDPSLFDGIIKERLIENPHRATITFKPDPGLQARRDTTFAEEMAHRKEMLSRADLEGILAETAELRAAQGTPNSPAALASLPQLRLSDLPRVPRAIPAQAFELKHTIPLIRSDVFANGVNYLLVAFDLDGLPRELWEYVPVLASVFSKLGAAGRSYAEMAERIAGSTGGLGAATSACADALDPTRTLSFFTASFKALDRTFPEALSLLRDLLMALDLSDTDRLRDVLIQRKVRLHSGIIPDGHRFAASHGARTVSTLAALGEIWGGLPQVRLADRLATDFSGQIDGLRVKLEDIRRFMLSRSRVRASFTGSDQLFEPTRLWLEQLGDDAAAGPASVRGPASFAAEAAPEPLREGLVTVADVAYCACCMPAPHASHPQAPLLQVFSRLLGYGYMWEEIRVKGGAYGGLSAYDAGAQIFELMSYRDPAVARTLEVYEKVLEHVRAAKWSKRDVERAVIGCAKADERPIRPAAATSAALWRHLGRLTEDLRMDRRAALLRATPKAVKEAGLQLLGDGLAKSNVCVLGGREDLQRANATMAKPLTLTDLSVQAPMQCACPGPNTVD